MNLVFFFFLKTADCDGIPMPMPIEEPRVSGKFFFFYHYSTRPGYDLKRLSMFAKLKLILKNYCHTCSFALMKMKLFEHIFGARNMGLRMEFLMKQLYKSKTRTTVLMRKSYGFFFLLRKTYFFKLLSAFSKVSFLILKVLLL